MIHGGHFLHILLAWFPRSTYGQQTLCLIQQGTPLLVAVKQILVLGLERSMKQLVGFPWSVDYEITQ